MVRLIQETDMEHGGTEIDELLSQIKAVSKQPPARRYKIDENTISLDGGDLLVRNRSRVSLRPVLRPLA